MQKLFEYAIIHNPNPTKADLDSGIKVKSRIVVDITRLLAADEKEAMLIAARAIPETLLDALDQVQIVLRPF